MSQADEVEAAKAAGLSYWFEWGKVRTAKPVDGSKFGPHHYGLLGDRSFIGSCAYRCGCEMNQSSCSGPVDPHGPCPKNPLPELPDPPDAKWIQTVSGRAFWPLDPKPEHVFIEDIAHALAMKCRFTGQCLHFYSVAQHSVLVSHAVPEQDALWGLMHDASEAYLPDVARPVKKDLPGFREIEDRVMAAIAERFGFPEEMPPSVKNADMVLLATERRDLMARAPFKWITTEKFTPLPEVIRPWGPQQSRFEFLRRWHELRPAAKKAA